MNYTEWANFFRTGIVVVWAVMVWSGNLEAGVVICLLLTVASGWCVMMSDDNDGGGPGELPRRKDPKAAKTLVPAPVRARRKDDA